MSGMVWLLVFEQILGIYASKLLYTWVEGLVSEHDAGTYTMVYHYKGTCICSLTK